MQMVNALSAVLARIYNKAEACLYAKLFGNRGCNLHKMAHERAVVNHGNVIIMLLGHYQNMYWRLRLKVIESYRLVILVYLFGRYFARGYLAENAILHFVMVPPSV